MQLIINCPTDKKGIKEFNCAFSKVQKELVLYCIRSLNIDRIEALETAIEAVNKVAEYENPKKEKKSLPMTKEEILLMNRLP